MHARLIKTGDAWTNTLASSTQGIGISRHLQNISLNAICASHCGTEAMLILSRREKCADHPAEISRRTIVQNSRRSPSVSSAWCPKTAAYSAIRKRCRATALQRVDYCPMFAQTLSLRVNTELNRAWYSPEVMKAQTIPRKLPGTRLFKTSSQKS